MAFTFSSDFTGTSIKSLIETEIQKVQSTIDGVNSAGNVDGWVQESSSTDSTSKTQVFTDHGTYVRVGTGFGTGNGKATHITYTDNNAVVDGTDISFDITKIKNLPKGEANTKHMTITDGTVTLDLSGNIHHSETNGFSLNLLKGRGLSEMQYVDSATNSTLIIDGKFGGKGNDTVGGTFSKVIFNDGTHTYTYNGAAIKLESLTSGTLEQFFTTHLTATPHDDTIVGTSLADNIRGGLGNDSLTGGDGNDIFIFDTKPNSLHNVDTITDFTSGTDSIELSHKIFKGYIAGADLTNDFVSGDGALDKTDHFIYDTTSGSLYYDADGSGHKAAIKIAVLGTDTHPMLDASDLHII